MHLTGFLAVCLLLLGSLLPGQVHAAGITNYPALVSAEYWTKQNTNGDQLVLDSKGVTAFNAKIRTASRTVPDLVQYPSSQSGDALKTRIMDYAVLEDDLYLHGNKVSENYKDILRKQTNISAVPSTVKTRYAVTVRRSPVRALPTGEGLYYYAADHDFDALQETMLDPGEPVLVLHQSANKYFYYVQSVNYSGWVSAFNLALTDRKNWESFAKPAQFLVVTAAELTLKTGGEQVLYQQGSRLPLLSRQGNTYTVLAPARKNDGTLLTMKLFVQKSEAVHEGYLPYTQNNILRSAFQFYNKAYGWGGQRNSVDCSSLIFNAYRTVGIILPRNADEQESSAGTKLLLSGTTADRQQALRTLTPGAGLYFDDHCLLYLGQLNGQPYAIHALGSYYRQGQRQQEMRVVVSDLSLTRANGNSFLDELTTAVEYK